VPAADVSDRIERLCLRGLSAKALRERVVALLRGVMSFEAHNFPLTDPVTMVGTSPFADVPMLPWPRLPELIRWRYQTIPQRWDTLMGSGPTTSLLASGPPETSPIWANVQCDLGVVDTATTVCADRYGCWGFLDLWRTTTAFTPTELSFLASLAPLLARGLRESLARTFVEPDSAQEQLGPAVVVLGPDLQVQAQTAGAAATLLRLNPPDESMAPIPAAAYNIGAALVATEADVAIGEPWSRVHLGGSRWVTLRADRLGQNIAVSIEPATPTERIDLLGRASGLSARESETLTLLAAGLENKQIAAALVVSEHTATDHVKAVLAKTGARTRQVLLARALGG
jgi:DNA-binding NarL/FixJ family response regulator